MDFLSKNIKNYPDAPPLTWFQICRSGRSSHVCPVSMMAKFRCKGGTFDPTLAKEIQHTKACGLKPCRTFFGVELETGDLMSSFTNVSLAPHRSLHCQPRILINMTACLDLTLICWHSDSSKVSNCWDISSSGEVKMKTNWWKLTTEAQNYHKDKHINTNMGMQEQPGIQNDNKGEQYDHKNITNDYKGNLLVQILLLNKCVLLQFCHNKEPSWNVCLSRQLSEICCVWRIDIHLNKPIFADESCEATSQWFHSPLGLWS